MLALYSLHELLKIKERLTLKTKVAVLKDKQSIDLAKMQLRLQEEELNLKTDIAVSEAKSKIPEQFDSDEISSVTKSKSSANSSSICSGLEAANEPVVNNVNFLKIAV